MSHPKGKLIAIGGAEDKGTNLETGEIYRNNLNFFELGILRRVVEESGGPASRIEVVTTASTIPYEVGENYLNAFGKVGCTHVNVMHIRTVIRCFSVAQSPTLKDCVQGNGLTTRAHSLDPVASCWAHLGVS